MSTKGRINAATTPLHVHAKNYRKLINQLIAQGLVTASQHGVKLTTSLHIKIDCKVPLTQTINGSETPVLAWWVESGLGGTGKTAPFLESVDTKPLPLEERGEDSLVPANYVACGSCRGKGSYGELASTETTICKRCLGTGAVRRGERRG